MNELPSHVDPLTLDRLVDGELSPVEYREVLATLEGSQDGWRQCAHAFLEAQALGHTLPLVMEPARQSPQAESALVTPTQEKPPHSFRGMEQLSALAACVAVAFGLGWYLSTLGGDAGGGSVTSPIMITDNKPTTPPIAVPPHEVKKPGFVYVNQWDGQNTTGIPIPVDPNRTYDPQKPWDDSWGMNPQDLQKYRDQGHPVETFNRLIPVSLDNGEQAVVPMQEVILHNKPELPFN